jgi:hypothetical protein
VNQPPDREAPDAPRVPGDREHRAVGHQLNPDLEKIEPREPLFPQEGVQGRRGEGSRQTAERDEREQAPDRRAR